MPDSPRILIADDESSMVDLYSFQLEGKYETLEAYGGTQALEKTDETVDVVLLDRRMPDLSGDEVLKQIREEGYDCQVVMVSAIEPTDGMIEMAVDDYLIKPAPEKELVEAIEHQLMIQEHGETLQELSRAQAKITALDRSERELNHPEKYEKLQQKVARLRAAEEKAADVLGHMN